MGNAIVIFCLSFIFGMIGGFLFISFILGVGDVNEKYDAYQEGYLDGYKEGQKE